MYDELITTPDGIRMFVTFSGQRPRCACGAKGTLQCDWKVATRRLTGTCDRYICATCTTSPAPDKDLCPEHAAAWKAHPTYVGPSR